MSSKIIDRRHPEWKDHHLRWRWLLDSYEGGEVYRQAIYSADATGMPVRNLIRHKREYPEPTVSSYGYLGGPSGQDQYAYATNDDYEMRRARTPVPKFLHRTISCHLAKVLAQDPNRVGTPALDEWWKDMDGSRTTIRRFVKDTLGPLLLIFGHLDIIIDHPAAPKDAVVASEADAQSLGLDRCVASYILPENLTWWKLDSLGRYQEAIVCETNEDGSQTYRHWTPTDWTLYDVKGKQIDKRPHPYRRPPIVRLFGKRRFRCKNIGMPPYEETAELQREFYNRDSELILSDVHQAHPIVQVPEDQFQATGAVPTGPGWAWPMKKIQNGSDVHYQGAEVLEFPKEAAEQIRKNKQDISDASDRAALMTKPAGAAAATGTTVAQSGISKRLDSDEGNTYLGDLAETLGAVETQLAELFLLVNGNGVVNPADLDKIKITYGKDFDLFGPDEMATLIADYQASLQGAGATPEADAEMIKRLMRQILKGLSDERYKELDDEIEAAIGEVVKAKQQRAEAASAMVDANADPNADPNADAADEGGSLPAAQADY